LNKFLQDSNNYNDKKYKKNSISLTGAVSMGTGLMIGAAIFALLGQVAFNKKK